MSSRVRQSPPRTTGKYTAAELIVAAMQAEQVSTAFGLVGTHIVEIYEALRRAPEIRHVTAKHEGNGALMADSYSRLSGKTSVCFSTAGPGLLNSLAGVGQAYAGNSPTVHISGSLPLGSPRRALHAVDDEDYTTKMLAPLTKLSVRPRSLAQLAELLPKCFAAARGAEPGPVHIEIPWDLMRAAPRPAPSYIRREFRYGVNRTGLGKLKKALKSARRPLFCIDALCLRHGVVDGVIALAEAGGAMLVVSYDAFGAVPSAHPLNAGVLSDFYFGTSALEALSKADLIVGFGVLERSESEALILKHARTKPILFGGRDLGAFAREPLLGGLAVKSAKSSTGVWFPRRCYDEWQKAVGLLAKPRRRGRMHFGRAMMKLREWIDGDMTVILDAGSHEIWARAILPSFGALSFIGSGNWGGMGYALPGLIGAKIAAPKRAAVAITGDGCLLMSIADLCTLASVGGPAVLIVMNNAMYGEIKRVQLERFGATSQTEIPELDFAAIARDVGLKGIRVEREDELGSAFGDALASRSPVVVDVACGGDVAFPCLP
jgi:acetolactate synthase-1/2/3 large subunit